MCVYRWNNYSLEEIIEKKLWRVEKDLQGRVVINSKEKLLNIFEEYSLSPVIFSLDYSVVVFPVNQNCSKLCNLEIVVKYVSIY